VSAHEFSFVLELSSEPPTPMLLQDLAARMLDFVGCRPKQATKSVGALRAAVEQIGAASGPSRLAFNATGGSLTITLAAGDHPEWRITQPIT